MNVRVRDILLIVVISVVMIGPAGMFLAKASGIPLPEALDPAAADYLAGDKKEVDLAASFNVEGFVSGRLQDDAETAVTNSIPAKASALFANAAMQRSAIEASNALYNWPCYRTYFNSEYLLVPEHGALVQEPYTDEVSPDGLAEFAAAANGYAAAHPELDVELLVVDRACTSASNPASQLVNDPFTTQMAVDIMNAALTEENVRVLSDCYEDPSDFFADFHRSDHHWNTNGVLKGMDALCESMGDDSIADAFARITAAGIRAVEGPSFSGTCVRNGLYQVDDDPLDFAYDFSGMRIVDENGEECAADTHPVYGQATELNRHYQYYDLYYRGGQKMLGAGEEDALLVSDSFGSALQWPLGECFSTLWTSNNLQYYSNSEERLADLCDMQACKRVIFAGCVLNYSNFLERNPNAFG